MPFACPDDVLRIGYVETAFPKFFVNVKEDWQGFIVDLWQTYARISGCNCVKFVRINNYTQLVLDEAPNHGHLGEIYAGRLFADAWGTLMNPSRLKYFKQSAVIAFEEVNFYTTVANARSETYDPVTHYIVFTPQAFAFVICLQLIVTFLTTRFRKTRAVFDFMKKFCEIIFLISFTSLMFAYSSGFKEAHYVYHEPPPINLYEMQSSLNKGSGKFIATASSVAQVYTSNYEVVPDLYDVTDRMCSHFDHYFTSMTKQKYVQVQSFDLPKDCLFKKVHKEPKSATEKLPAFAARPFSLFTILNKSTPRSEVVRLNRRDGFYVRRYAPITEQKKMQIERTSFPDATRFKSLSLTSLALPFIAYIGCILTCIAVFLIEYFLLALLFKRVTVVPRSIMTSKVADLGAEMPEIAAPLFSLKSHRLRICLFLLLALYMGSANRMALSTGIVCMVNVSTSAHHNSNFSYASECVRAGSKSNEDELAVEGHLAWTPPQQSFLLSSSFYGSFITIFVSGAIIDQFSPSKILSVGLIVSALLTVVAPFLADISYEVLVGSRVSFIVPAINMLATRWFPTSEKTTLAALYTSGLQFAAGGASLLAAQICRSTTLHGWPSIFYIFGVVTLVFVVVWFIFVNDRPSASRWTSENEKKYLEEHIVAPKKKPSLRTSPWKALATSIPVHSILLCSFAFGFSTSTMQAYLPTYLREQLALPVDKIGLYTLAPFVAQIIAKTICGPLTDYVARKGITSLTTATKIAQSLGSFGASGALMAFAYFPTCSNPESALPILIIYGAVYAGGVCGFFTSLLTIAPKYTGTLSALSQLFSMLACIVSSSLVTTLTSMETPYKWPIVFGAASLLQAGAGAHYLFCGSTEQQYWSDGAHEKTPSV